MRYIGTFRVQFRPLAVRELLSDKGADYMDARSKPIVVLPVFINGKHPVLWEETTRWRAVWDSAPKDDGLVPIVTPAGDLNDIAALSTEEAADGKTDAIKAFIDKYQAGGAVVATLKGNPDTPAAGFKIDIQFYDADGNASLPQHRVVPMPLDVDKGAAADAMFAQGIKDVHEILEKVWKNENGHDALAAGGEALSAPTAVTNWLPVTVPVETLAQWTQLKRRIGSVPGVQRINVLSLQSGSASIEIDPRKTRMTCKPP